MQNIKLTLQFDGTHYHGWQRQENAMTVQQKLEDTIEKLTGEKIVIMGCGRTDAGVHAKFFIANFYTNTVVPIHNLTYVLNTQLPLDIRIIKAEVVSMAFHAQKDAVLKTYEYRIENKFLADPFGRCFQWNIPLPLNFEDMCEAAKPIVGTHDFVSLCSAHTTVMDTVRTVTNLELSKRDDIITISVSANGFLYNMVRIIAGTLVCVGNGKLDKNEIANIISQKDRTKAGVTAPPQGLSLVDVKY